MSQEYFKHKYLKYKHKYNVLYKIYKSGGNPHQDLIDDIRNYVTNRQLNLQVFESPETVRKLQRLIDQYKELKNDDYSCINVGLDYCRNCGNTIEAGCEVCGLCANCCRGEFCECDCDQCVAFNNLNIKLLAIAEQAMYLLFEDNDERYMPRYLGDVIESDTTSYVAPAAGGALFQD